MERSERHLSEERRVFYRYMSRAEAEAVVTTGLLRGGRRGRTYWTDERYEAGRQAKARLALGEPPEIRFAFTIVNDPRLDLEGSTVRPDMDEPGGGLEWMTRERVRVEVISVDNIE
ncbi:MAG: hypothetical protein ACRDTR_01700 [Rubrobacter sp.]